MKDATHSWSVKVLTFGLAALLGGGMGSLIAFSARHEKSDTTTPVVAAPEPLEQTSTHPLETPSAASVGDRRLLPELEEILALGTLEERMLAMRLWAKQLDPAQARAAFHQILETRAHPTRAYLLSALVERWAEGDGSAVIAAVQRLPARERNFLLSSAYGGWSRTDPLAAWEAIKELPRDDRVARRSVPMILTNMAHLDLRVAFDMASQALASSAPGLGGSHLGAIVHAAAQDGRLPEVLALLEALPAGQNRAFGVQLAYAQWARADSEEPLRHIAQMTDPELAKAATTGFLAGWAQTDPAAAIQFALDRHDDPLVAEGLTSAFFSSIDQLAGADLRAVLAQLADRGLMPTFGRSVVGALVSAGHGALAAESVLRMPAGDERQALVASLMSTWPRVDLPAAVGFFEQMPPGLERDRALPTIGAAAVVADGNLARVQGWLAQTPEAERVGATTSFVIQIASQAGRLSESTRAELARLVADTPSLPSQVRERATRAIGSPPGP